MKWQLQKGYTGPRIKVEGKERRTPGWEKVMIKKDRARHLNEPHSIFLNENH